MKNFISSAIIFLAFTQFINCQTVTNGTTQSKDKFEEIASAFLEECITYNESVGISAGISLNGIIRWTDGAGFADMERQIPAKGNMLHRIASISKPMTAIAIMQLYEAGKLDLDDPIQKYVSEFPLKKEGTITIRHLLNQTSGINAYQSNSEAFSTKNYPTLIDAISVFKDRNLVNKPGSAYHYTTYGYVVLGVVIERASGISYADYMKENVWTKSEMKNTSVEVFGEEYSNKTKLYNKQRNGQIAPDLNTNLSIKVPGGGIQSTVEDLLLFGEAILKNRLVTQATLDLMIKNNGIKKRGNPYGFGWFLYADSTKSTGRIIGHSGSQSGTSTQLMIYLDKKIVVATLSNTSGVWSKVLGLNNRLGNYAIDPESVNSPLKKEVKISNKILDKYTGNYHMENGETAKVIRKKENLYFLIKNNSMKMYAESIDRFFLRSIYYGDANVLFTLDDNGNISKLEIDDNRKKALFNKSGNHKPIAWSLYNQLLENGIEKGLKWYRKQQNREIYKLDKYEMKQVANELLRSNLTDAAIEVFKLNVKAFPQAKDAIDEGVINNIGYQLLQSGKKKQAIVIFELNANTFPNSANAFDSLGEAYMVAGNKELAITNYEKSISINPVSETGIAALKKLKGSE